MFTPPGFEAHSVKTSLGEMVYYTADTSPWLSEDADREQERETLVFLHGFGGGSSAYEWSKVYLDVLRVRTEWVVRICVELRCGSGCLQGLSLSDRVQRMKLAKGWVRFSMPKNLPVVASNSFALALRRGQYVYCLNT